MIENLEFIENKVSWLYNDVKKIVAVDGVLFACDDKLEHRIVIHMKCEKNFIEQYSYDYNGDLCMHFTTKEKIISWNYSGKNEVLFIENLFNVGFFPKYNLIFLAYSYNLNKKVDALNLAGDYLYELAVPSGYQFYYFQESEDDILAVCTADIEHQDEFGRSDFNFKIELETGYLIKKGLAY